MKLYFLRHILIVSNQFYNTREGIFIQEKDVSVSPFLMLVCYFCERDKFQNNTPPSMSICNEINNKLDYAEQVWNFLLLNLFPREEDLFKKEVKCFFLL